MNPCIEKRFKGGCIKEFIKFLLNKGVYHEYIAAIMHNDKVNKNQWDYVMEQPARYISGAFRWIDSNIYFNLDIDWGILSILWRDKLKKNK